MNETRIGKWIKFIDDTPANRKTRIWIVAEQANDGALGEVKWYGPWRQYAFFPWAMMVFEKDCLRDIANWCEDASKKHRDTLKRLKDAT